MMCYCNSKKDFSECCESIIKGTKQAETAEQLMRSRYSAFVIADINYLMNSHYKTTRPTKERSEILKWTKSVQWLTLEVLNTQGGLASDTEGYVEFKAVFMKNGKIDCIYEDSFFVKENKQWYYKSGKHL